MRVVTSDNWLDAQYSVLGSALIDERVVPQIISETDETDYSGGCRHVFRAIKSLFDKHIPVDPVSVNNALGGNYNQFLTSLMEITPTAANVGTYIQICREQARVLAIRDLAGQFVQVNTVAEARALLEKANALAASTQRQHSVTLQQAFTDFGRRMQEHPKYLSWPIQQIRDNLRVRAGNVVLIAAEPSVGKTAFALQCAVHWAKNTSVGFFSFETDPETLGDRIASHVMSISMEDIQNRKLTDKQWERYAYLGSQNADRKLTLEPASGMTVSDIRARIVEKGYQVVVIDYLQLIPSRGSTRYEQVTNISLALHELAQSLKVTVIALSQVSRSDDDHTPRNSDLRESGQLEQDADVIIFLKLRNKAKPEGPRRLYVTKYKEGKRFQTNLSFDGETQTFAWISEVEAKAFDAVTATGKNYKQKKPPVPDVPENPEVPGQMEMLPDDTPVPFTDDEAEAWDGR